MKSKSLTGSFVVGSLSRTDVTPVHTHLIHSSSVSEEEELLCYSVFCCHLLDKTWKFLRVFHTFSLCFLHRKRQQRHIISAYGSAVTQTGEDHI